MGISVAWFQNKIKLPTMARGFHLITHRIVSAIPQIVEIKIGMLHVFIQHTSASLTINENADPDVRVDFETAMNDICKEHPDFIHTYEGPDDMPAHVKSSLLGNSLNIPVSDGELALGIWQGIYLCEHRDHASPRNLMLTLQGA